MSAAANGTVRAGDDLKSDRAAKKSKMDVDSDYNWDSVHQDLENDIFCGTHGNVNSAYFGMAEMRAGVNMNDFHKKRWKDEFYLPELKGLIENKSIRKNWNKINTFDPLGMFSRRPTMSGTRAQLNVPEISDSLVPDGKIVNDDHSINIVKMAVDYVWNIPRLSKRLGFDETEMRERMYKYTKCDDVKDPTKRAFLPPVGGCTVYFFGDPRKLADPATEVTVRVHDQCTGSDVFGTDICTCRPYLVFAIYHAVETAQRGGVGVVVYFQKEGRSLGEVTKYRVYNARHAQAGGDRSETYFMQTENIAGIRDARFQEMMPDVLVWLGIERIDWLLSMSSEKYDAITEAGIEVMQRVALPDKFVPAHADVEIAAKIMSGYHTDSVESDTVIAHLRKPETIRERCGQVFALAEKDETKHISLHMDKLPALVEYVEAEIKNNYPDLDVPYHSRWRHFTYGSIEALSAPWPCSKIEKARRMIDLVTVSVLLDAGAGPTWKYVCEDGSVVARSEGIAIASLDMFKSGMFSSDVALPHRVNAHGLKALKLEDVGAGFQATDENPMAGMEGRYKLLLRLGDALRENKRFFGAEVARPGHIVDYVMSRVVDNKVSMRELWCAVLEGLESIWPQNISGVRRGDVWVYNPLKKIGEVGSDMVTFHKLSQWLMLSMLEPIEELGVTFTDTELFTGLAEYRNGGLFVDGGVLQLKDASKAKQSFHPGSELVVEWRALTLCLLDRMHDSLCERLSLSKEQFQLYKLLQGGTWAAGRRIAKEKRPETGGTPPINIRSDGSVF
jgi:GTP cyclohydrolase II